MLNSNQKVAVGNVLSAIRPKSLRERLESDLEFSHYQGKKDFKKFIKHSVELSDAFQLVDTGLKHGKKFEADRSGCGSRGGNSHDQPTPSGKFGSKKSSPNSSKSQRRLSDCPDDPCKQNGLKYRTFSALAEAKLRDGPAKSTCSQRSVKASYTTKSSWVKDKPAGTSGRLATNNQTDPVGKDKPSCQVAVSDGQTSLHAFGRCDDGSDYSIASPRLAGKCAIKGIGKMKAITPV